MEGLVLGVGEDLHAQLPLGERTGLDGVGEVAAVEVGVEAAEHLGLLPGEGVHAEPRLPVELHQGGRTLGVDHPEGVHAEALHHPVGARDAAVGHVPDGVVLGFGVQRDEVPERVVRGLRLRDLAVRVRLAGVDDVGELDAVLDEEDRHVVADQVPGALVGVELRGEAAGVAHGVGRAAAAQHRGEADEGRRTPALLEDAGQADLTGGAVALEVAVRGRATGVHHPLGDALVVEVGDLLAQVVVLEQGRAARPGLERVVGVAQLHAGGGGQPAALLAAGGALLALQRLAGGGAQLRGALVGLRGQRVVGRSGLLHRGRLGGGGAGDLVSRRVTHGCSFVRGGGRTGRPRSSRPGARR